MEEFIEIRAAKSRLRRRTKEHLLHIQNRYSNLIYQVHAKLEHDELEQYLASTLIQSTARRKFAYWKYNELCHERDSAKLIQKRIRGVLDRKRARERLWKTRAVVPNLYALKKMRMRCRELETVGHWTEMFDPITESFWYLNKVESFELRLDQDNKDDQIRHQSIDNYDKKYHLNHVKTMPYTCWKAPKEFSSQLVCYWNPPCSSTAKCCLQFSNRNEYNRHRLTMHHWYCSTCETKNTSLTYPRCFACDNYLDDSGEDLYSKLEKDVKEVLEMLDKQKSKDEDHEMSTINLPGTESMIKKNASNGRKEQGLIHETADAQNQKTTCLPSIAGDSNKGVVQTIPLEIYYSSNKPKESPLDLLQNCVEDCRNAAYTQPNQRLLVCKRFRVGACSLTTCPMAHPGIRDSSKEIKTRDGSGQIQFHVEVCIDFLMTSECCNGNQCSKYHPYLRPSTKQIIRTVYPLRNGTRRKNFTNGTVQDGTVKENVFQGYGILQWPSGDVYMGIFRNGWRHGTGIWRSYDGKQEYCGMWENGVRSGWGVLSHTGEQSYCGYWKGGQFHGIGKLESANGDRYEGEFAHGKYEGIGIFKKKSGDVFMGRCQSGQASGLGILKLATGEIFRGMFKDNVRHGKGICISPNGSKYIGIWKNNSHNGHGLFRSADGDTFVGSWERGKKHGFGTYRSKNGDVYEGDFVFDKAEGVGAYRYSGSPKRHYYGEWKNDKRHGRGEYHWESGSIYKGQWEENHIEGRGVLKLASGAKYVGYFRRSKKHGTGCFTWPNGDQYKGHFENDKMSGKGIMIYSNGSIYDGMWKENKKNGNGILKLENGNTYIGMFVNDKKQGKGKLNLAPGTVIEQSYVGDWFGDQRNGWGKYVYHKDLGQIYIGDWRSGLRHGKGKLFFKDGSEYNGDFVMDKQTGKGTYTGIKEKYDGDFLDGQYFGKGVQTTKEGIYTGDFKSNVKHGYGKLAFLDGSTFIGQWEDGIMCGKGKFQLKTSNADTIPMNVFGC